MAYINDLLRQHPTELIQFRNRILDVLPRLKDDFRRGDLCIFKFLVARDFNVDKAEEMLRQNIQWREVNKADHMLSVKLSPEVVRSFPISFCGRDKRGCVVIYHPLGKWQLKKVVKSGLTAEAATLLRQVGEQVTELSGHLSTNEKQVCQYYGIYDMEGYDYTQLMSLDVTRAIRELLGDYLNNYPEILENIRIINAPKLFQMAWHVIEPVLTGRTIAKVGIYGPNKDAWKAKLLEEVDANNLPSCLGGSITTNYFFKMEQGNEAFPKYKDLNEAEFQETMVPAGQKHLIDFQLKSGDQLAWNFKTDDYDIGFQVDGPDGSVVTNHRTDSHKLVMKGLTVCKNSGKYTLIFDNSFSKFKTKKIYYVTETIRC